MEDKTFIERLKEFNGFIGPKQKNSQVAKPRFNTPTLRISSSSFVKILDLYCRGYMPGDRVQIGIFEGHIVFKKSEDGFTLRASGNNKLSMNLGRRYLKEELQQFICNDKYVSDRNCDTFIFLRVDGDYVYTEREEERTGRYWQLQRSEGERYDIKY